MSIRRTVGIVGATALVVVVAFATYAFAQSNGDGRGLPGGAPWHRGEWHDWHRDGWQPTPDRVQQVRTDLAADLATELGTSADQVEAALRGVVQQRLQEAIDAEEMDQAAADEALAAYDEGDIRAFVQVLKHDRPSEAATPS